jgi:hypothetical protein
VVSSRISFAILVRFYARHMPDRALKECTRLIRPRISRRIGGGHCQSPPHTALQALARFESGLRLQPLLSDAIDSICVTDYHSSQGSLQEFNRLGGPKPSIRLQV